MHPEYSWCILSTHDASWVLMMHHEHSWCIMSTHDASWVFMMHPICHQMARHISREDFDQTDLDCFSGRVFANFKIVQVFTFNFMNLFLFWFHFGRIQEDLGSLQGPLRISRYHLGGNLWWSDFPRTPKIMTNQLLKVSRDQILQNSGQSMRNRCPVTFQRSDYQTNTISM